MVLCFSKKSHNKSFFYNFQKVAVVLVAITTVVLCQRPPYAGQRKPYPEVQPWFTTPSTSTAGGLGDRFNAPTTSTERLPIDAYGDRELFNQIATWPREKWPFWLVFFFLF